MKNGKQRYLTLSVMVALGLMGNVAYGWNIVWSSVDNPSYENVCREFHDHSFDNQFWARGIWKDEKCILATGLGMAERVPEKPYVSDPPPSNPTLTLKGRDVSVVPPRGGENEPGDQFTVKVISPTSDVPVDVVFTKTPEGAWISSDEAMIPSIPVGGRTTIPADKIKDGSIVVAKSHDKGNPITDDRPYIGLSVGQSFDTQPKPPVLPEKHKTIKAGTNIEVSENDEGWVIATKSDVVFKRVSVGTVVIDENGIDAGGKKITNVATGTAPHDAVNVVQLRQSIARSNKSVWGSIASVAATNGVPQAVLAGKTMIGVGFGHHKGQSALAVGISGVSEGGAQVFKFNLGASTLGDYTISTGMGYQW